MQMDSESSMSDQAIYERIVESVLDHRLPPGTRLTEDKLGSIFGVSRTRIKPILVRLANEKSSHWRRTEGRRWHNRRMKNRKKFLRHGA